MATSPVAMEIQQMTDLNPEVASGSSSSSSRDAPPVQEENLEEKEADSSSVVGAKVAEVRRRVGASVDRALDESHSYRTAVRAAFHQFQRQPATELPLAHLLPALQFFIQRLSDSLDPKCGKLILRPITQEDILSSTKTNSSLSLQSSLTLAQFEGFAREAVKRVALERSKRLGVFVVAGLVAVHMAKNAARSIPFVGGPIGAVAGVLIPTSLVGPAVGIAGALCL